MSNTKLEMKDVIDNLEFFNQYFPVDVTKEALESLDNPKTRIGLIYSVKNEDGKNNYQVEIYIESEKRPMLSTGKIPQEALADILPHRIHQELSDDELQKLIRERYENQLRKPQATDTV